MPGRPPWRHAPTRHDDGFDDDGGGKGIDEEEAVARAGAHVPVAIALHEGLRESHVVAVGDRREHPIDLCAAQAVYGARLPRHDRGVQGGAEDDGGASGSQKTLNSAADVTSPRR